MQVMFPIVYALADVWYNMSFYGDLLFTVVRTLFVVMMTQLITWSRISELSEEEEKRERELARREEGSASGDGADDEFGTSLCAERRRRIARLTAGVQWHPRSRRLRPRRD
ncbi:hypothetical protein PYW07_008920 [Mythimna separata]|uniref:Uncharacterized protein n=1 Tax=Mythimna separata TaxID=271217 RepID=A0AAD7YAY4_MYTSE|nr:hypothetical protein PYW07_008920 [Mythimna separata]